MIIFQHYVMNCLKNSLPFYLFHFLKIRNFLSRLFFDWYKDLSIFQFSFPSCRLICNRITFGIFSNIIGMRSDPKCSCWIPTVFKALTLLSIRSYKSLNSGNHLFCLILSICLYVRILLVGDSHTFFSKVPMLEYKYRLSRGSFLQLVEELFPNSLTNTWISLH